MKAIEFKGCNSIFAKDQPEYLQLPAHKSNGGIVTSCWKLSFKERCKLTLSGRVFLQVMTFNKPLQPLKIVICDLFSKLQIDKLQKER